MLASDNRRKSSIEDYDPVFRNVHEKGQNMHPELFTTGVFIGDSSLRRRPRRGATIEAENINVETADIEPINKWRER